MDALQSTLGTFAPPGEGYLPWYMLVLSTIAVGNSIQNLLTLHYSRRVYNGLFVRNPTLPQATSTFDPDDSVGKLVGAPAPAYNSREMAAKLGAADQCTPLAARLFGTWTLVQSLVRLHAAYNLDSAPMYRLALATYFVAFAHFASEYLYFKSMTSIGKPQIFPFILSTVGIVWMLSQYSFYVKG